jgi:hypothetical protein
MCSVARAVAVAVDGSSDSRALLLVDCDQELRPPLSAASAWDERIDASSVVYFTGKRPTTDEVEKLRRVSGANCVDGRRVGPTMTLLVVDQSSTYGVCKKYREAMRLGVPVVTLELLRAWLRRQ